MIIKGSHRDLILQLISKKVFLEGNILKLLRAEEGDTEINDYLTACKDKDQSARKKRLAITKKIQSQNRELIDADKANNALMRQISESLEQTKIAKDEADKARHEAELLRDAAVEDLDALQKRVQTELIGTIVRVSLIVICSVGLLTTGLYIYVMSIGADTKIVESTWSNLFGILLTNSFSIIGTIMGVKYATEKQ
tara:strand:- start:640 stop:1227 length:588 start_codon:yes stop_codon:yes gene_type:complete